MPIFSILIFLALGLIACESPPAPAPPVKDILGTEKKLYSQYDEELIVRQFFQDERDGIFVDVGCAYPIRMSTTYYLERHLGWTGVAIDAVPAYADMWQRERPNTPFLQYAVMDTVGDEISFFVAGEPGLSSVSKEIVDIWGGPEPVEITVPTITLDRLLEDQGIERIDFLSMDIEGAEPMALAGFDIQRFRPRLICIEAHSSPEHESRLYDYFTRHGYTRLDKYINHDIVNWYFAPAIP